MGGKNGLIRMKEIYSKASYQLPNGTLKDKQIKELKSELHDKRVMVAAIDKRVTENHINADTWMALIGNRNEHLTRIEIIKRKLYCLQYSGRFNGTSIEPHY